eukprot:4700833-Prymnesium_polylepis.3
MLACYPCLVYKATAGKGIMGPDQDHKAVKIVKAIKRKSASRGLKIGFPALGHWPPPSSMRPAHRHVLQLVNR